MTPETLKTLEAFARAAIADPGERAEALKALAPKPPAREKYFTTRQAAEFAGCVRKTLFRWARQGHLHPRRITPSRVRWAKSELETFLCETAEG